jgi:hypothetical protein
MEPLASLQCFQASATGPYSKAHDSNLHTQTLFLKDQIFHLRTPSGQLPSGFLTRNLCLQYSFQLKKGVIGQTRRWNGERSVCKISIWKHRE